MTKSIILAFLACALLGAHSVHGASSGKLQVVATIPDLADIVSAVGGDLVEVTTICKGRENVHSMRPAPSHLVALSRADLLVQQGLSLEGTWLPGLLMNARNKRIAPGQPGFVSASEGWEALQVPDDLSRKGGDVHPFGNPHMNLDPRAGRHIAARVLAGLSATAPASSAVFEANHAAYLELLTAAEARWQAQGAGLVGTKVVTFHQEFDYLASRYGMEIVGTVESKPGIPPTAAHLAELIGIMQTRGVKVVLTAAWSNDKQVKNLAERTGSRVLELPTMVGGGKGADTWIAMQDLIHARLVEALTPEAVQQE